MPDPADSATPTTPSSSSRPRRTRKFVLPDHHHDEQLDERATEHIEAFLEGPEATPRRRAEDLKRDRRPIELDTRPDWIAAVRLEGARHLRYGRPVSILLIELRQAAHGSAADRIARRLGDVIRAEARETDRAVRTSALTFRVLLPETGGRAARALAERLDRGFRVGADGAAGPAELCVEVATAARGETLEDALAEAASRLAARTGDRTDAR